MGSKKSCFCRKDFVNLFKLGLGRLSRSMERYTPLSIKLINILENVCNAVCKLQHDRTMIQVFCCYLSLNSYLEVAMCAGEP